MFGNHRLLKLQGTLEIKYFSLLYLIVRNHCPEGDADLTNDKQLLHNYFFYYTTLN